MHHCAVLHTIMKLHQDGRLTELIQRILVGNQSHEVKIHRVTVGRHLQQQCTTDQGKQRSKGDHLQFYNTLGRLESATSTQK